MRYLPDTNACIVYLKGRNDRLRDRLNATPNHEIALCSTVKAESWFGAAKRLDASRRLVELAAFFAPFASLPFDDEAAHQHGEIRARLAGAGTPIGPYDLMVAAIALANGLIVVTHNTDEFRRVPGLTVEDWEA